MPLDPADWLRRAWKELSLWFVYLHFRLRYGAIRPVDGSKGEVLLVSLLFSLPTVLWQAGMLSGLATLGYEPVVLTYRSFTWAQRYFQLFGVRRFVYLDDLLADVDAAEAIAPLALPAPVTFASVHALEWQGIALGRHVLSTIVRRLAQGTPSFDDPEVQTMLESLVPETVRLAAAARLLFDRTSPKAVLFHEKGYVPFGVLFDVAVSRGLNVIQFHHTHQSDLINVRRFSAGNRFQHPFSFSQKSWDRVKSEPWSATQEEAFMEELKESYVSGKWFNRTLLLKDRSVVPPDEVRRALSLDSKRKVAVIFSHILWDATFFFGDNLFPDYERWLIATVGAAIENRDVQWVIKLHPDYSWKMQQMGDRRPPRDLVALKEAYGELPDHVRIVLPDSPISTYAYFSLIDYCITVRGTIGIEAPCFGIPVFTAGTGRYSGLGFTNDSPTAEEYLGKLKHLQDFPRLTPEQTSLARRHAYSLFHRRPMQIRSIELTAAGKGQRGLTQATVIRAPSLPALSCTEDIRRFAEWVAHSTDEDYLAPVP